VRRRMELTGTNSSIGLIVLQSNPCIRMALLQTLMSSSQSSPNGRKPKGQSDILFADLVALPGVPHPIPFRTRSLSPPGPMVLRLKARESRSPPGPPKGYQPQVQTLHTISQQHPDAGWSSPVARQAHNLKVTGSNPVPAPKVPKSEGPECSPRPIAVGVFLYLGAQFRVAFAPRSLSDPRLFLAVAAFRPVFSAQSP
jgi:hypothetical protein